MRLPSTRELERSDYHRTITVAVQYSIVALVPHLVAAVFVFFCRIVHSQRIDDDYYDDEDDYYPQDLPEEEKTPVCDDKKASTRTSHAVDATNILLWRHCVVL